MRRLLPVLVLGLLLTACASPGGAAAPSPVPSEPTETATPTPTVTAPPATIDPTQDPVPEFTPETLAQTCIDATRDLYDADASFSPEQVRVENRKVDPPYLVIVPARSGALEGVAFCTIGGTPEAPEFGARGASIPLTEEEITRMVESNTLYGEGDK